MGLRPVSPLSRGRQSSKSQCIAPCAQGRAPLHGHRLPRGVAQETRSFGAFALAQLAEEPARETSRSGGSGGGSAGRPCLCRSRLTAGPAARAARRSAAPRAATEPVVSRPLSGQARTPGLRAPVAPHAEAPAPTLGLMEAPGGDATRLTEPAEEPGAHHGRHLLATQLARSRDGLGGLCHRSFWSPGSNAEISAADAAADAAAALLPAPPRRHLAPAHSAPSRLLTGRTIEARRGLGRRGLGSKTTERAARRLLRPAHHPRRLHSPLRREDKWNRDSLNTWS